MGIVIVMLAFLAALGACHLCVYLFIPRRRRHSWKANHIGMMMSISIGAAILAFFYVANHEHAGVQNDGCDGVIYRGGMDASC